MILVAGAGGFIGGHLVAQLLRDGHVVRAVDIKPKSEWWQWHSQAENWEKIDLSKELWCIASLRGVDVHAVYNLAADMGGMGFIEHNKALCMRSVLINTNLIEAARVARVDHYFYASSACVYNVGLQGLNDSRPLRESDAYPAMAEDGYGWEKLFSERMCRHYCEDFHVPVTVARLHNVYGPYGTWRGGREKAPAAICRKVAEAKQYGLPDIEIWGDGEQTRSFMYADDCVEGIQRLLATCVRTPVNLGSSERVTINQLVDLAEYFAGVRLKRRYNLKAPKGVNGRSSDNTFIRSLTSWEPSIPLAVGLEKTYKWIYDQVKGAGPSPREAQDE